jgi:hypothetical protein
MPDIFNGLGSNKQLLHHGKHQFAGRAVGFWPTL